MRVSLTPGQSEASAQRVVGDWVFTLKVEARTCDDGGSGDCEEVAARAAPARTVDPADPPAGGDLTTAYPTYSCYQHTSTVEATNKIFGNLAYRFRHVSSWCFDGDAVWACSGGQNGEAGYTWKYDGTVQSVIDALGPRCEGDYVACISEESGSFEHRVSISLFTLEEQIVVSGESTMGPNGFFEYATV